MQTFLPYPDFTKSLSCLDYRRLGKQRVEAKQLINALTGVSSGWRNHPAARMWSNNIDALMLYHNVCLHCWEQRGYVNNMPYFSLPEYHAIEVPVWFGRKDFHDSHKSNLLRKAPEYYGPLGWDVPTDLEYVWPNPE